MSDSNWTQKGATLSDKSARKEFGLTQDKIFDAIFREVIIPAYRFFYKIKGDVVWIVAVWHGPQLPKQPTH